MKELLDIMNGTGKDVDIGKRYNYVTLPMAFEGKEQLGITADSYHIMLFQV